jgi:hypothetical protein
LILSNVVDLAVNGLVGRYKFQRSAHFWKSKKRSEGPEDNKWKPWAGLSSVVIVAVQAIVTAVLIRAGGYKASLQDLILLWFIRPRMMWSQMLWYVVFGVQYKGSATDAYFADLILNVFSIPIAVAITETWTKYPTLCGPDSCASFYISDPNLPGISRAFGSPYSTVLLSYASVIYLGFAAAYIFFLIFFLYKQKLSRGWAVGALFWTTTMFGLSWWFWASKLPHSNIQALFFPE